MVKLTIDDKTYKGLKDHLTKLRIAFGVHKVEARNTDEFAETILRNYLTRKRDEASKQNPNNGPDWQLVKHRVENFIYARDNGSCKYCSKQLSKKEMTIDHVVPPMRGGNNEVSNLVAACKWCNSDKGMLTGEEYQYKQLANAAKGIYPPA